MYISVCNIQKEMRLLINGEKKNSTRIFYKDMLKIQ